MFLFFFFFLAWNDKRFSLSDLLPFEIIRPGKKKGFWMQLESCSSVWLGPRCCNRNTHSPTVDRARSCRPSWRLDWCTGVGDDGLSGPPLMSSGLIHWFILQILYQYFLSKMFPFVFVYRCYIFYPIGSCCLMELLKFNRFWCLMMIFSNPQYKYLFTVLNCYLIWKKKKKKNSAFRHPYQSNPPPSL